MKEKKKTVTFAIADSPNEEDLALIREDWHEAARAGKQYFLIMAQRSFD
jgi:hypothetical protein